MRDAISKSLGAEPVKLLRPRYWDEKKRFKHSFIAIFSTAEECNRAFTEGMSKFSNKVSYGVVPGKAFDDSGEHFELTLPVKKCTRSEGLYSTMKLVVSKYDGQKDMEENFRGRPLL